MCVIEDDYVMQNIYNVNEGDYILFLKIFFPFCALLLS